MVTSQKAPQFPYIPVAAEVVSAPKRATARAMANILETHRSYIGPPGMNPQAVAAFRAAVTAALTDPALLEETRKGERPVAPMDGAQQQKVIAEITRASASLSPILKAAVNEIQ
jgi:hypothetical protein